MKTFYITYDSELSRSYRSRDWTIQNRRNFLLAVTSAVPITLQWETTYTRRHT